MRAGRLAALIVFGCSMVFAGGAQAQTPEAVGGIGVLAQYSVPAMTGEATEAWFLRYELAPQGSLPEMPSIGYDVVVIESGLLTVTTTMEISVTKAGGQTEIMPAGEMVLEPGDAMMAPDQGTIAARNDGDEPAVFLDFMVFSGMREGEAEEGVTGEPVGATTHMLSVGGAAIGEGPGTITIERIELKGGDVEERSGQPAIEAGYVESGTLMLRVESGSGYLWQGVGTAEPEKGDFARPIRFEGMIDATLLPADGYFLGPETTCMLGTTDQPVVILRATVTEG